MGKLRSSVSKPSFKPTDLYNVAHKGICLKRIKDMADSIAIPFGKAFKMFFGSCCNFNPPTHVLSVATDDAVPAVFL